MISIWLHGCKITPWIYSAFKDHEVIPVFYQANVFSDPGISSARSYDYTSVSPSITE